MKKPFTKEEQEIMDLLKDAHKKFMKIEQYHKDDLNKWVRGIHECQETLMLRVIQRDYKEVFTGYKNKNHE